MSEKIYEVPAAWRRARPHRRCALPRHVCPLGRRPRTFWREQGRRIDWIKPFTKVKNTSFDPRRRVDQVVRGRHTQRLRPTASTATSTKRGDQAAIIWEGDDPRTVDAASPTASCTSEVCRFANVLKALGVRKGDRVTIYMPMIPEAAYAMLACARIGAVHSVVFGGFSPDSLASRIKDCELRRCVITADEGVRGGRKRAAQGECRRGRPTKAGGVEHSARGRGAPAATVAMQAGRDVWYHEAAATASARVRARADGRRGPAVHPLHVRLDRRAEGRAAHHRAAISSMSSMTHQYVFDYHDGDIYWCTADVGWVTGHSYIVYGPLANGATTLMFEGVPNYPERLAASGR